MTLEIIIPLNIVYIVGLLVIWLCYFAYLKNGTKAASFSVFGFVDKSGDIQYFPLGVVTF